MNSKQDLLKEIHTKTCYIIKRLNTKKIIINPGPDGPTGKFYQTLREELTPILVTLMYKEDTLSVTFFEANIILISKLKVPQEKKTTG